jgi:penicillin-binding protein 1B
VRRGPPPPERFPSYTGQVRDELSRRLPLEAAEHWGLSIFTTLDLVWQSEAEESLARGVGDVERWMGRRPQPLEGAFVAIDPGSGSVLALVGGRSLQAGNCNRATRALRQPGSAI